MALFPLYNDALSDDSPPSLQRRIAKKVVKCARNHSWTQKGESAATYSPPKKGESVVWAKVWSQKCCFTLTGTVLPRIWCVLLNQGGPAIECRHQKHQCEATNDGFK